MAVRTSLTFPAKTSYKKLDFFLRSKGISRRLITALKYVDCLKINGQPATTITPVFAGDVVTLVFPREEALSCEAQAGELHVLYEDDDILAVCKPHGIATHPALGTASGTLGNFVSYYYQSQGCPLPFRPVSRLDKETEGLLIIAKHKLAHHSLSQQQKNGSFQKKYLALVEGVPAKEKGEINLPIAREAQTSLRRVVRCDGKPAHTLYRVLYSGKHHSLLEVELKTGRTHQIRVHLSHIGHPIVGDPLYGTPGKRLYLHSYAAKFLHPITKEQMELTAPCNFETILSKIENEEPIS